MERVVKKCQYDEKYYSDIYKGVYKKTDRDNLKLEKFIKKASEIHKNKYSYEEVKFNMNIDKITIICPIHQKFTQTVASHLVGAGCPTCGTLRTRVQYDEFVKRARSIHGDKYDYSKTECIPNEKTIITCDKHGDFKMKIMLHLAGSGCNQCAIDVHKYTNEDVDNFLLKHTKFIRLSNYEGYDKKIILKCTTCDYKRETTYKDFSYLGIRCQNCTGYLKNERLVKDTIKDLNIKNEKLIIRLSDRRIFPDFYLPEYNLVIEYHGPQHFQIVDFSGHSPEKAAEKFEKQKIRDQLLRNWCLENKKELLEIDGRIYKHIKLVEFVKNYFAIKIKI